MPSPFLDALVDVEIDDSGDVVIGANGDFAKVFGPDAVTQNIEFRLRTVVGDWQLYPQCGASLEQFIGAVNSPDTGAAIEDAVTTALTHDGFIAPSDLTVVATPVNSNEIAIMVSVPVNGKPQTLVASLLLREGMLFLP